MKQEKENGWDGQDSDQHGNSILNSTRDQYGSEQMPHSQRKHISHKFVIPFVGTAYERHEKRCMVRALADVPRGASILNWPCEHGRLLPFLKQLGYSVTCVDASSHAVAQARFYGGFLGEACIDDTDDFQVVDILQGGFDDGSFDAAIVNHLFYYCPKSQTQQQVLKELGRICSGPIVISFFHIIVPEKMGRGEQQTRNSIPINRRRFTQEVSKCGLTVIKWIPKYSVFSKQACAIIARKKGF